MAQHSWSRLSIPGRSSAFGHLLLTCVWLGRSLNSHHHQPCLCVLQFLIQNHMAPPYTPPDLTVGWWGPFYTLPNHMANLPPHGCLPSFKSWPTGFYWTHFWVFPQWATFCQSFLQFTFSLLPLPVRAGRAWWHRVNCLPVSHTGAGTGEPPPCFAQAV